MNAPLTSPVEGAPWQVSVPWARAWLDIPGWVDARGKPYGPRVLRGALLNALQLPGGMHSDFDGRDAAGKTLDRPAPICYRVRNGRPQVWLMGELAGGVSVIFFQAPGTRGDSPIPVFELADGGIEGVVEGLASKGVTIVTPVSHAPDGGLTADFADPDGHQWEVFWMDEAAAPAQM